jgi:choline-sulfatase
MFESVKQYNRMRPERLLFCAVVGLTGLTGLLAGCRPQGPTHVLFITVDTLRADRLGCYGYGPARTPEIDRLAREGLRVKDAIAAAPITLPAHSSIFTGLYPPAHGVRDNGTYALGNDAVTLAERLKQAGYSTHAVVSALVLNRRYNLSQGFDGYDDDLWSEDEPKLFMIRDRPAAKTARRVVSWLRRWSSAGAAGKPRQPFFVWVHFFDPHQPYDPPQQDRVLSPTLYDAEIAAVDHGIATILDELRRRDLLDDTLVVLTADHGESLGEHQEKTHAVFIYDATVRVPLLFRHPRLFPEGKVYDGPVRSVDIVPTLLAALGLPGGNETQGVDLLPAFRGQVPPPALAQYSESLLSEVGFGMAPLYGVRSGGFKWIRAPQPEVYDLRRDPAERHNLYPREARRGAQLDRELSRILEESEHRSLAAQKSPMDRETLENLQALGYLAPAAERQSMQGIDPKDGIALYNKLEDARHAAQRQQWGDAEKLLQEVLAVTPENVSAINVLALCRLRQNHLDPARETYLHSLSLDSRQSRVYGMLGTLDLMQGDLDKAERNYRQALAMTPGFVEAMSNLGMIEALRGREAEAQAWYEKAIAADPGFPWVYRRLADLHYERGDFDQAFVGYKRVLRAIPGDFAALVQAGNSARHKGDGKVAAELFQRAEKLRPDSWIPLYNLACLRATQGDPRRALALLERLPDKGFDRIDLLEGDGDLARVRELPDFQRLVAQLKGELTRGPARSG